MTVDTVETIEAEAAVTKPAVQRPFLAGLMLSLVYGVVAVLICGVAWGLVSYFTGTIYLIGAIILGGIISFALTAGFTRVNWAVALLMFAPAVVFTIASVVWGDFIYYTLIAVKELQMTLPAAVGEVAANLVELMTSAKGGAGSLVFAAIGAVIGFYLSMKN